MGSRLKRLGWWMGLSVVAVGNVSAAQAPEANPGMEIFNRSCLSCHDVRRVNVQALDSAGWLAVINRMVGYGATVEGLDRLVLLDYLVRSHGPVPEGPGKDILLNRCTICHDLSRVRAHLSTADHWREVLQSMLNEGAFLTDEEFDVLLNYLATNFGQPE